MLAAASTRAHSSTRVWRRAARTGVSMADSSLARRCPLYRREVPVDFFGVVTTRRDITERTASSQRVLLPHLDLSGPVGRQSNLDHFPCASTGAPNGSPTTRLRGIR